jgi:GH35 family endo-1,4-beta-xylanase
MDTRHLNALLVCFNIVLVFLGQLGSASDDDNSNGVVYDSFATTECQKQPPPSSYGGGIVVNPEFNSSLDGWSPFGGSKLEIRLDEDGNEYLVASGRQNSYDSPSQKINLTQGMMYSLSAWLQIGGANTSSAVVKATVATSSGDVTSYNCAGTVIAHSGCWSLLKGGLNLDISPESATLYFESPDTGIEIWLDSVSFQPFSVNQWQEQQEASIEKNRKGIFIIHAVNSTGHPLLEAELFINQTGRDFPIGSAIAKTILGNDAYQKWFVERFNVATFENELKWYSTESQRGSENYKDADDMVNFCKTNNISIRGHNIFWEDPKYTPRWVKSLDAEQLQQAVDSRIRSLVGRYKGQFLSWDVSNEMLHFSFFEDKLGPNASANFFQLAQQLDPSTPMFMNDYNTIETCNDMKATPDEYLKKLSDISQPLLMEGIGLESHFSKPNIPFMRSVLDKLGSMGLPIWLTEVDITNIGNQTKQGEYLDQVLREAFSHPAVNGIVMWSALHPYGCYRMCLTDDNFNNLPTGDVVDKLMEEWITTGISGFTDNSGTFNFSGFFGEYTATVTHSNITSTASFKVSMDATAADQPQHIDLLV